MTQMRALRLLAKRLTAPVFAQGITAATSLMLQVSAAHALGLAEFGMFALFLALLWTAAGLYTGYIGDGLTVLERHDPRVRSALATSALSAAAIFAAIGAGTVLVIRQGDHLLALVYAAVVVAWFARETVRRLCIARIEFGKLIATDLLYMAIVFGTLVAFHLTSGISMLGLFCAMALSATISVVFGVVLLPRHEFTQLRPRLAGLRELASFAAWRSAQAALRPASLLFARLLVANILSFAAAGLLEAARLVVAALQVVLNGAAGYLIASFARAEREGMLRSGRLTTQASVLLFAATMLCGGALVLFADPVGRVMTGGTVDPILVLGWVAYLAVWAIGLPCTTECIARQHSRAVFEARLVDSTVGLVLVGVALLAGAGVVVVPWLMAVGGLYTVWRMRALALAGRSPV